MVLSKAFLSVLVFLLPAYSVSAEDGPKKARSKITQSMIDSFPTNPIAVAADTDLKYQVLSAQIETHESSNRIRATLGANEILARYPNATQSWKANLQSKVETYYDYQDKTKSWSEIVENSFSLGLSVSPQPVTADVNVVPALAKFSNWVKAEEAKSDLIALLGLKDFNDLDRLSFSQTTALVKNSVARGEFDAIAQKFHLPTTTPQETNADFARRTSPNLQTILISDQLSTLQLTEEQIKINLMKLETALKNFQANRSSHQSHFPEGMSSQEKWDKLQSDAALSFAPFHFATAILHAAARNESKETQAGILLVSFFIQAAQKIHVFDLAKNIPDLASKASFSQLKLDLVSLATNLLAGIFSLLATGPSELSIVMDEIQKLREQLIHFEGGTFSRLDRLESSLNYFAQQTEKTLDRIHFKIDRLREDIADNQSENNRQFEALRFDHSDSKLQGRRDSRRRILQMSDAFTQKILSDDDSKFGWSTEKARHYQGFLDQLAQSHDEKMNGFTTTGERTVADLSWFPLGPQLGQVTTRALPKPLSNEVVVGTDSQTVGKAFLGRTAALSANDGPWIHLGESLAAAAAILRQEQGLDLGSKESTSPSKSGLETDTIFNQLAPLAKDPGVLAQELAAVGRAAHQYSEAKRTNTVDLNADIPQFCIDLTRYLLKSYESLLAVKKILPEDRHHRPDLVPLMYIARDYLRNLRYVENHIHQLGSQAAPIRPPTELRTWAKGISPSLFVQNSEGAYGIAPCADQQTRSEYFQGETQYPLLDIRKFSELGVPIERWTDLISTETLHLMHSFGGDLKLCYEWREAPADYRFEKNEDGVIFRTVDSNVGISFKTIYRPPGSAVEESHLDPSGLDQALNRLGKLGVERPPGLAGNQYYVLSQKTVFSPVIVKDTSKREFKASIRPEDRNKPKIEEGFLDIAEVRALVGTLKEGQWQLSRLVPQTWVFDGFVDETGDDKALGSKAGTFFRLSSPDLQDEKAKAWAQGLVQAIFETSQNSKKLPFVTGFSNEPGQPRVELRSELPQIEDSTPWRVKSHLATVILEKAKQRYFERAERVSEEFSDPQSKLRQLLASMEGARRILANLVQVSYAGQVPNEVSEAMRAMPSEASVISEHRKLGGSFLTKGPAELVSQEKALRKVLEKVSDRRQGETRDLSPLELSAQTAFRILEDLIERREELGLAKTCDPSPKQTVQTGAFNLAENLDRLRSLKSQLEKEQSSKVTSKEVPSRIFAHRIYTNLSDQNRFADTLHRALKGDADLAYLLGDGLKTLALGTRTGEDMAQKDPEQNPRTWQAANLLKKDLRRSGYASDQNANALGAAIKSAGEAIIGRLFPRPKPIPKHPSVDHLRALVAKRLEFLYKDLVDDFRFNQPRLKLEEVLKPAGFSTSLKWFDPAHDSSLQAGVFLLKGRTEEELLFVDEKLNRIERAVFILKSRTWDISKAFDEFESFARNPQHQQELKNEISRFLATLILEDKIYRDAKSPSLAFFKDARLEELLKPEIEDLAKMLQDPASAPNLNFNNILRPGNREAIDVLREQQRELVRSDSKRQDHHGATRALLADLLDRGKAPVQDIQRMESILDASPEKEIASLEGVLDYLRLDARMHSLDRESFAYSMMLRGYLPYLTLELDKEIGPALLASVPAGGVFEFEPFQVEMSARLKKYFERHKTRWQQMVEQLRVQRANEPALNAPNSRLPRLRYAISEQLDSELQRLLSAVSDHLEKDIPPSKLQDQWNLLRMVKWQLDVAGMKPPNGEHLPSAEQIEKVRKSVTELVEAFQKVSGNP
jgi:hypothetical protein